MKKYAIGIDIGASHIGIGLLDTNLRKLIFKKSYLYKCNADKEKFVTEVCKAIENLLKDSETKECEIERIGIGCPGDCDISQGILLIAPNLKLKNIAIKEKIEAKFNIKTYIENDATCALLGEYYFGTLRGKEEAIMIVSGTGIGFAGFSYKNGIQTFDIQYCNSLSNIFKDGYSNKTFNSGSLAYLQDIYMKKLKENNLDYRNVDRKKIFEDVLLKNEIAQNVLDSYLDEFAKGIVNLYKKTKVKTYCIGGGISEYSKIFADNLKERLPNVEISFAKHQNNSAIIGASLLD